jgi:hypothetical protein
MPEFHITWEIDVTAADPVEAARKAFSLVRKPDSSANCFDVIPHDDSTGESVRVDLEEHGIDWENDMPREMLAALRAIRARINGEWDHPDLLKFGPLGNTIDDILMIIEQVEDKAEGRDGGA